MTKVPWGHALVSLSYLEMRNLPQNPGFLIALFCSFLMYFYHHHHRHQHHHHHHHHSSLYFEIQIFIESKPKIKHQA